MSAFSHRVCCAAVFAAALVAACGEEGPSASAVKPTPGPQAPINLNVDVVPYLYDPTGKRDPFRSIYTAEGGVLSLEGAELTPLQRWDIDQLRLVAVVWGSEAPVAMVEDPDGRGFVLRAGTLIGKNWGRVTRILRDAVEVTETYRDPAGGIHHNRLFLKFLVEAEEVAAENLAPEASE